MLPSHCPAPGRAVTARPSPAGSIMPIKKISSPVDNVSEGGPVIVESATTGRSRCTACKKSIGIGEERVGVAEMKGGVLRHVWFDPHCFLKSARVDYNTSGRGKCKVTGVSFAKGNFRFAFKVDRFMKKESFLSLDGARSIVPKIARAAQNFNLSDTMGFKVLNSEDQKAFLTFSQQSSAKAKKKAFSGDEVSQGASKKAKV